jgi:hypothetical protein
MKNIKTVSKILLFIMVFSIFATILPAVDAYASTNTKKEIVVAKKETLTQIYDLNNVNSGIKTAIKTGSTPVDQDSVDKKLRDAKDDDKFKDIKDDEREALGDLQGTDMCGRHDGGWIGLGSLNDSTYLEFLLFLVGDATGPKFEDVTKKTLADFNLQPEAVPSTAYKCFPDAWKEKYKTKAEWEAYQDEHGTKSCGTFDLGCKVEKLLKEWIREAIVAGMTWIMDIATGSGSGDAADACRPNRGDQGTTEGEHQTLDTSDEIPVGFTADQAQACDNFLARYYAMSDSSNAQNNDEGKQLLAAGPTLRAAPTPGSGDTSINSDSQTKFYGKSSTIALYLAMAMVIGGVIQGMIQSKPVIIFKVVFIYVPLFGMGIYLAPLFTKYLLELIDGLSYYMADNSARDIANVANGFGTTAAAAAGNVSAVQAVGGAVFLANMMGNAMSVLSIVVGTFLFVTLALWALMAFREAAILLVLALLPISLAMAIWPALAKIAQKFIKLLISLVVSKIPIVMALSMGLNMLSEWIDAHQTTASSVIGTADASGGMRQFILALAIFMLALAAPTFVISLFDAVGDMAQTMGSKVHTGAARSAIQASSLKANMGAQLGSAKNARTQLQPGGGSTIGGDSDGPKAPSGVNPADPSTSAPKPGTPGTDPSASPSSTAGPGAATAGDGDSGSSGPEHGFWKDWKDASRQVSHSTDGRGRPAKQYQNGGFGQHLGKGIYGRAQRNQQKNIESDRGPLRRGLATAKNVTMGAVGEHIHRQGRANSAGLRLKASIINPVSVFKGAAKGGWDIGRMGK